MPFTITHAGPDLFDCHCLTRCEDVGPDGIRRLTQVDTVEASRPRPRPPGHRPRCSVVEVIAPAVRRAA